MDGVVREDDAIEEGNFVRIELVALRNERVETRHDRIELVGLLEEVNRCDVIEEEHLQHCDVNFRELHDIIGMGEKC